MEENKEKEMLEIRGKICSERYYSSENGFGIANFQKKDPAEKSGKIAAKKEILTIKGTFPRRPVSGMSFIARGVWETHKEYGDQFSADLICEDIPVSLKELRQYLITGSAPGISPELGQSICRHFGPDLKEVMFGDMDRLTEIKGIKAKRLKKIKRLWSEQVGRYDVIIVLRNLGISQRTSEKIWEIYKGDSVEVVKTNPYRLATEVDGIGFRTADEIALSVGYDPEGEDRLCAGITYSLQVMAESAGHVFLYESQLLKEAVRYLQVKKELIEAQVDRMAKKKDLIREASPAGEDRVYLPPLYYAEKNVAERLLRHSAMHFSQGRHISVEEIEASLGIEYNEDQREAISLAGTFGAFILTGGPGTGKTTVTNGIIRKSLLLGKKDILLAAPTGRAAKRMSEASGGEEAKTIHRLLRYDPKEGKFKKNEYDNLSGDLLLIDEASMIDIRLMSSLLKAVPVTMPIVFIGDVDQLPSVGPGRVFAEMIESGAVPTIRLTKIYRQAESSAIIMNAHRIIHGQGLKVGGSDFLFHEYTDPYALEDTIVDFFTKKMPEHYETGIENIQILCPSKKGVCGAIELNKKIQKRLSGEKPCVVHGEQTYAVGDRVMQTKNNYDDEVFNGDIGTVTELDPENIEVVVDYGGKEVAYNKRNLDQLTLSYAMTVHKSQGSEFDYVIIPMTDSVFFGLLQRNLFYTGVTRAKKLIVLLGSRNAISRSIKNISIQKRNTALCERLQGS